MKAKNPRKTASPEHVYKMPAEWEPHEATWIAWPHEKTDWPGKFGPIPWVYCEIVRHLSRVERVRILISDRDAEQAARRMLSKAGANKEAIEFCHIATNRSWTRDYCPIFVRDEREKLVISNWRFNGWAKYADWEIDDAVPSLIAKRLGFREVKPALGRRRIVLEGGSIDVNGSGTLLTTEECLLSDVQERNPGLTREQLEEIFARYLGIKKTLWLKNGIAGDDTHGHIDDLARFTDPATVVIAVEQDRSDPNHEPLRENLQLLRTMTDQDGNSLKVIPLPMPHPVYFAGQRLPASYANFYIANGIVLVPTFNDLNDRVALNTLAEAFHEREVCGIYCGDLVLGLGTLHCLSQQQPVRDTMGR